MSQQHTQMMTSGVFSHRSRLSPKALRIYDELGLLRPTEVDPGNGYRYYTEDQLEPARLIGLLRTLAMPLSRIAELVDMDPPTAAASLRDYWANQETQHEMKRALAGHVERLLTGKGESMYEIETRDIGEQRVATIKRRVLAPELPTFIGESMTTLYETLTSAGVSTGIPFVAYHGEVNLDSDGPVEVCIPYEGSVQVTDSITLRAEPAHREAFTRITKEHVAFPKILEAYDAVAAWLSENEYSVSASPREVYFVDFEAVGAGDPACDIAFPFA